MCFGIFCAFKDPIALQDTCVVCDGVHSDVASCTTAATCPPNEVSNLIVSTHEQRPLKRRFRIIFRDFMVSEMQEPSFLKKAGILRCKFTKKIVSLVCFVSEYIGNIVSFLDNIVNSVEPPISVEYTCSRYQKIYLSMKN